MGTFQNSSLLERAMSPGRASSSASASASRLDSVVAFSRLDSVVEGSADEFAVSSLSLSVCVCV